MSIDFAAVTKARLAAIATNATLRNAAVALSSPHIGLVIICEENRIVAGVVSKSDLVAAASRQTYPKVQVYLLSWWQNLAGCTVSGARYVRNHGLATRGATEDTAVGKAVSRRRQT